MRLMNVSAVLLVLLLTLGSSPQTPQNSQASQTILARVIEVDVIAVAKPAVPITGLTRADFILFEDHVPQGIQRVVEHGPSDVHNVMVFDTGSLDFPDAAYAREQVAAFLKKATLSSPVCVYALDVSGLKLIHDCTTDNQTLGRAVQSKEATPQIRSYRPARPVPRGVALRSLEAELNRFPGRTNLIWFYGASWGKGTCPIDSLSGSVSCETTSLRFPQGFFRASSTVSTGGNTVTHLSSIAVYPIDARGVLNASGGEDAILDQGDQGIRVAHNSGGEAFYNSNAIRKDLQNIFAIGSRYYTISYASTNTVWDGTQRNLQVLTKSNPEIHLEYRREYRAQ